MSKTDPPELAGLSAELTETRLVRVPQMLAARWLVSSVSGAAETAGAGSRTSEETNSGTNLPAFISGEITGPPP
jgi:hypothetical protein